MLFGYGTGWLVQSEILGLEEQKNPERRSVSSGGASQCRWYRSWRQILE